jgi:IMP dehydrogenase
MARIIGKGYSYDDVLIVPKYNKIRSRKEVDFTTKVTRNYSINLPIIAANMDTVCESEMAITIGRMGGLGVIHRFLTIEKQVAEVKKVKQYNLICAAAIGIKDYEQRVPELEKAGVNILVLDIAHGHSKYAGKTLDWIKTNYPKIDVMCGNIATKDAAEYFLSKGADAVKVGIGPGSMCTTRIMSGAGVPQVTAIMDVYEAIRGEIPICADGGIRQPGDIVKAIGAGVDNVMLGFVLAGTKESPGKVLKEKGKMVKDYRGMASYDATIKKLQLNGEKIEVIAVEGVATKIPYKGNVEPIIKKYVGGLASGMTYIGANNMKKIIGKADFIYMTSAGRGESIAHGKKD